MLPGHVGLLTEIIPQVVELLVLDEPPAPPEDRGIPLRGLRGVHPAELDDQHAVGQALLLPPKELREARAVERRALRRVEAAEIDERREEVLGFRQLRDIARRPQPARGPADEARDAMAAFIEVDLLPTHAGVPDRHAHGPAVVGHEDEDRVLPEAVLHEECAEIPHVLVDVRDHSEEARDGARLALVGLAILVRTEERPVRRVRRQVRKERFALRRALLHPLHRLAEEDVGAIPRVLLASAVVHVRVVEVIVVPEVRSGRDVRGRKEDRLVETAVLGPEGIDIAQVPLAELSRAVAGRREDVRHRRKAGAQERPPARDVHRPVAQRVAARHDLPARRRAHGGDVEVGEPDALSMEAIEHRRPKHGVAVAGEITVALVVRQDDDDVRPRPGRKCGRSDAPGEEEQRGKRDLHHGFPPINARALCRASPGRARPSSP